MKKKLHKITLATVLALGLCVLTACGSNADGPSGSNGGTHTHAWGEYVSVSDQGHVQVCAECGAQSAPTLHVFSDESDPDCNDCGFTREVRAPVSSSTGNVAARLGYRDPNDPTYDQDLILYTDGTCDMLFPNFPDEDIKGESYSVDGDKITLKIWGEDYTGDLTTDASGGIVEIRLDMMGELVVYKKLDDGTITLGYRDPNDPTYDQDLILYADGTYDLLLPNFPDEDTKGASYSVDDDKLTLNDLFGETYVCDLITDASGGIVEVRMDMMGELVVYKKLGGDTVTLGYRDPNDESFNQDLILHADGTYDLLFPSFPDEEVKGEGYTVDGDKITLNNLWGESYTGTAAVDGTGTIVAVDIDIMGEKVVYKVLD